MRKRIKMKVRKNAHGTMSKETIGSGFIYVRPGVKDEWFVDWNANRG
jgi:hypothetical protein